MGIQEKISQKYKELVSHKFDNKPKYQKIIEYIIINEPNLMDDDRIFCFLFDKIAVNNGFNECELPSYWTIGRAIYNYKRKHNIKASSSAPKTTRLIIDIDKYNTLLQVYKFDNKKPSIKKIIEKIGIFDNYLLHNDRKLVEYFDAIALLNGYNENKLPKYWTIIREVFEYKRKIKAENIVR